MTNLRIINSLKVRYIYILIVIISEMATRLGLDNNITPFQQENILEADRKFNKFIINTLQSALKGLGYGVVASIFFYRKKRIMFYSAGFGAGYSIFSTFNICDCL